MKVFVNKTISISKIIVIKIQIRTQLAKKLQAEIINNI